MATVSSSACADDAHAAWGDPGDSPQSFRLTASPSAIVESGAACPDRLRTRLPSVAGTCRVQRPAAATCPVRSSRRVNGASPDGGKRSRAASRRDGPSRSHEKPRGARCRGGLAEYGRLVTLPETRLLRARMPRPTLTAAAAPGRRAARGFSGPSATAREARPLAAVAPADSSAPAICEMGSLDLSAPDESAGHNHRDARSSCDE